MGWENDLFPLCIREVNETSLLGQDTHRTLKKKKNPVLFFFIFVSRYQRIYFLSQILLSYTGRCFMVNKSESNILPPTPCADQERTLTFWPSPAASMCTHSAQTSHNIPNTILYLERPGLWNHEEELAPRTKQMCHIGVV